MKHFVLYVIALGFIMLAIFSPKEDYHSGAFDLAQRIFACLVSAIIVYTSFEVRKEDAEKDRLTKLYNLIEDKAWDELFDKEVLNVPLKEKLYLKENYKIIKR